MQLLNSIILYIGTPDAGHQNSFILFSGVHCDITVSLSLKCHIIYVQFVSTNVGLGARDSSVGKSVTSQAGGPGFKSHWGPDLGHINAWMKGEEITSCKSYCTS